jgi:DNA polymerase III subunit gamma/tau
MSLYLRFRPQTFAELRGQDHIRTSLSTSVASGRTSHAYLFTGPRGTGKTSTARILARALNCEDLQNGDPCLKCPSCQAIGSGASIDLLEIDAASNRGIDEIRELKEKVRFTPAAARYKIFIIDEVHMLTKEAFNALLKTLEEPPAHVVFILATTEPHKVPETVISRCQRFDFGRIGQGELVGRLAEIATSEGVQIDEGVLEAIAVQADGGFRDALGLLDQLSAGRGGVVKMADVRDLLSISADETAEALARAIMRREAQAGLAALSRYADDGGDITVLHRSLLRLVRSLLLAKTADVAVLERELSGARLAAARELAGAFSVEQLLELAHEWQRSSERKHDLVPGLWLELSLLKLIPSEGALADGAPQEPATGTAPVSKKKVPPPPKAERSEPEAQPAAPAQGERDPGRLRSEWGEIVSKVRGYNHSVAACLQVASPEGVEGDAVIVAFPYKFHRERIDELKNRRIVERVLSEHLGGTYRLQSVLREREVEPARDDLVEAALEILGGEVIG